MLVLSRKMGERIHIGEDIFVEVRRVAGNRVTLAVCAPKNVRILRGELFVSNDAAGVGSVDVLDDDHAVSESSIDTVIMRDAQAAAMEKILSSAATSNLPVEASVAIPVTH
jgi:carbon storage regulator CsrA